MAVSVALRPGTYYVGVRLPWFVSYSLVRERLYQVGFRNIRFLPRDANPTVSAERGGVIDPAIDPHMGDDWTEWIVADYPGETAHTPRGAPWAFALWTPEIEPDDGLLPNIGDMVREELAEVKAGATRAATVAALLGAGVLGAGLALALSKRSRMK